MPSLVTCAVFVVVKTFAAVGTLVAMDSASAPADNVLDTEEEVVHPETVVTKETALNGGDDELRKRHVLD